MTCLAPLSVFGSHLRILDVKKGQSQKSKGKSCIWALLQNSVKPKRVLGLGDLGFGALSVLVPWCVGVQGFLGLGLYRVESFRLSRKRFASVFLFQQDVNVPGLLERRVLLRLPRLRGRKLLLRGLEILNPPSFARSLSSSSGSLQTFGHRVQAERCQCSGMLKRKSGSCQSKGDVRIF